MRTGVEAAAAYGSHGARHHKAAGETSGNSHVERRAVEAEGSGGARQCTAVMVRGIPRLQVRQGGTAGWEDGGGECLEKGWGEGWKEGWEGRGAVCVGLGSVRWP